MKRFRYILVTKALLSHLSMNEIEAVIAHEIGHVKKRHLLLYLLFFMGYMLLSYAVFDMAIYGVMYIEPLHRFLTGIVSFQTAYSLMVGIAAIGIFLIYFRYIFGYFMRNFERQADTYVYTLFDTAAPLISTFEKITLHSGQSPDKPNWHHFSVSERVDYLKKCEYDRRWIGRQDKKIRKSIVSYLVGVLMLSGVGVYFNSQALETTLLREIGRNPRSASLYELLGDMYYTQKKYDKTAQAYEKSLELASDNPKVLNNLAWLYATSEDGHIRDTNRAVDLAQRAVSLSGEPHVWDTLAESYYANKEYENSVFAGKKALELASHDKAYYEKQLKKFMRAVIESRGRIAI
jgi:tetratricopeptide (TPR) repeat protein